MSFVLPLLIASSLTAGAASTPSAVPAGHRIEYRKYGTVDYGSNER